MRKLQIPELACPTMSNASHVNLCSLCKLIYNQMTVQDYDESSASDSNGQVEFGAGQSSEEEPMPDMAQSRKRAVKKTTPIACEPVFLV